MDKETPIWESDWIFQSDKGVKFIVKNIPSKGNNSLFIMKDEGQVKRALGYISATPSIKRKLKPINVKLKKQIGLGKTE